MRRFLAERPECGFVLAHRLLEMLEYDTDDDPLRDDEEPDEWDDDEVDDLVDCPACGAEVFEDSVRCPVCGEYIVAGTSAWSGRPVWWILLGAAGVVATVLALTL